jgi:hypothetical protein
MTLIEDFPTVDMGEVAEPPKVMPLDWGFRLAGGREIFLTRIQQHRTCGSMLCPRAKAPKVTRSAGYRSHADGRTREASAVSGDLRLPEVSPRPSGLAGAG